MRSVFKALITNLIVFIIMTALCVFVMIVFYLGLNPSVQVNFFNLGLFYMKSVWFTTLILSCAVINLRCFLTTGKKTLEVLTVSIIFAGGLFLFLYLPPSVAPVDSLHLSLPVKAFIPTENSVVFVNNSDSLTIEGIFSSTTSTGKRLSNAQGALIKGNTITSNDFTVGYRSANPVYDSYYRPDPLSKGLLNTVNRLNTVLYPLAVSRNQFLYIALLLTACMCFGTTILRSTRSLLSNVFLYLGFVLLLIFLIGFPAHPLYESLAKMTSSDYFPQPFAIPLIGALTVLLSLHLIVRVIGSKFRRRK